jgi:hypothetical protein
MPKVTMFYHADALQFQSGELRGLGQAIREYVADLASTDDVKLGIDDVDFIPQPYPQGTLTADPIAFEIETIGFKSRKEGITFERLTTLKGKFINELSCVAGCPPIKVERPLIWLKYVDPDGHHV